MGHLTLELLQQLLVLVELEGKGGITGNTGVRGE